MGNHRLKKRLISSYYYLVALGGLLKSPVLFLCRLYWGWLFAQSGLEKLQDIHSFADLLISLNFPLPYMNAYLAAYIELIGGICLMLGFASRLAAIPLAVTMTVAYLTVHSEAVRHILINPAEFVAEAPFNFLLTSLIVLAFGPGRLSLDYLLEKWFFRTA